MGVSAFFVFAGIQKVIKKVINAGKESPAKVLRKINRPQSGLFFCAKTGEVFKKNFIPILIPPPLHFWYENSNQIFPKFVADFEQIRPQKCI